MRPGVCTVCAVLVGSAWVRALGGAGADADADKTALAVEALSRLPATDLENNPKLKEAVLRVLEKTRGTPNFVKLVQKFQVPSQNAGLLDVAIAQPAGEAGVEATRMLLAGDGVGIINQTLTGTNAAAARSFAEALGNTAEKQAVPLLLPLLQNSQLDLGVRKQAVRSLAKTREGARATVRLADEDKLPTDLKLTAGAELSRVRWPEIKAEAVKALPPPVGQGSQPLPPVAELAKWKGDPANGARIFTNATPGCSNCHVVRGQGTELGPNLSEIGTKLGKDALFEAILEPSAGISFGYEAYSFTLKNGDEAYGLLASETADEIVVKGVGGIVTRLKKNEVASRQASKLSLMPAGLQAAMTPQELVDLVDYLTTLRKP